MSESWFATKGDSKEVQETEKPLQEPDPVEDPKPKPKRSGFSLFRAKAKSPDTTKKSGFGLFRKKSPQPKEGEEEEEEVEESVKDSNKGGFSFFTRNKSDSNEDDFEEEGEKAEEDAAAEEEEEEEEEEGGTFEDSMRNVLRKLGVEVEDDDDWKQMVIKTRLTLKDFKDSLIGSKS